ncbi:phage tail fiber protein [Citrobacter freundii ATCC 8090 = MTCC 1658 = NBRC 12681]|uniref:phage tail protein n=1 Tax=Citrobacter freundii TaxID=546 RepID=UPI000299BA59|nr:phage tail protein [Citrobacter freundii]EKS58827.1 tail fiber protein [Citrobacter freundii ATCC 8090 = MTCC 1658 = NBRC 12681]EXF29671.1 tail protein [Citrobacter freundii RLS1]KFC00672.1 phage tail fiber protein [Citrobacter freundii ATCC 8090 = MTCC 1658 = NBRC 12681]WOY56229.1 phage tail protein [Citrobacter freundii]WOY61199.1 phage tail protein [Citrobacter freundii]
MATKYFALLTNIGAAKLAKATALGTKVEITQMAVGDGNGVLPTPDPAQTALIHEIRRAPLNMLTVDPANASQIIAEQVIPEDVGGWWIREIGLFDKDGDMIAVANCAETYKPQLQEGSGRVQAIRVILIVSSTEAVTLKIDPAVVLATRQYVDNKIIEVKSYADGLMRTHEQSRNHPDATTTAKGFTQLNSSVTDDSETQAATPKAVKIAMDNAGARLAKDRNLADLPNPALARQNLQLGDSSTKNTGTTANTVAAGDDARITGAMQKNQNGADIPDVAKFLQNLDLGDVLHAGKNLYEIAEKGAAHQASARDNLALNAIAAIVGSTNKLPYFVDINTAELADFTAFARTLLSRTDASAVRGDLGLKSAALRDVGVGANQIPDVSFFANSLYQNGFMKLPGGLMLQWGLGVGVHGTASVTFNQAFVNRPFFVGFGYKQSTFPSAMQSIIINDEFFDNTAFSARTLMFDGTTMAASPNAFLWYALGV